MEFFHRPLSELRSEYGKVKKLGGGGFGQVYLLQHWESSEHCAAKYQKLVTPHAQRLVRREVRILRKLCAEHQNHIVHYIDYFEVRKTAL